MRDFENLKAKIQRSILKQKLPDFEPVVIPCYIDKNPARLFFMNRQGVLYLMGRIDNENRPVDFDGKKYTIKRIKKYADITESIWGSFTNSLKKQRLTYNMIGYDLYKSNKPKGIIKKGAIHGL